MTPDEVAAALNAAGSRGLVGFDLAEGAYFHRELPFDLTMVESLHPRLKDARKLVAGGGIRVTGRGPPGLRPSFREQGRRASRLNHR